MRLGYLMYAGHMTDIYINYNLHRYSELICNKICTIICTIFTHMTGMTIKYIIIFHFNVHPKRESTALIWLRP
jgi:hypothetical protein